MKGFYTLSYQNNSPQIVYAISAREAHQKGYKFADDNNDTLLDVRRDETKRLQIFDLAPIHPNVGYLDAIEKFKEFLPAPVYFGYDITKMSVEGMVHFIDINARKAGIVPIESKKDFLDADKHWLTFSLRGEKIEKEPNHTYAISVIEYATMIDKINK